MPPASPVPGWCSGEVCTLSMATRRGRRTAPGRRSPERPGNGPWERLRSLDTYWLTAGYLLAGTAWAGACGASEARNNGPGASISL